MAPLPSCPLAWAAYKCRPVDSEHSAVSSGIGPSAAGLTLPFFPPHSAWNTDMVGGAVQDLEEEAAPSGWVGQSDRRSLLPGTMEPRCQPGLIVPTLSCKKEADFSLIEAPVICSIHSSDI